MITFKPSKSLRHIAKKETNNNNDVALFDKVVVLYQKLKNSDNLIVREEVIFELAFGYLGLLVGILQGMLRLFIFSIDIVYLSFCILLTIRLFPEFKSSGLKAINSLMAFPFFIQDWSTLNASVLLS
jgi:hypothetical protein